MADWSRLEDAYGSAEGVPRELAKLSSASARTRASALGRLEARICHQGSVYSASLAAVPLLLERVRSRTQKDKAAIVALLVDVAIGDHGNFLDAALAGPKAPRRGGKTLEARCFDATVDFTNPEQFKFKMIGDDPKEPGLEFKKGS